MGILCCKFYWWQLSTQEKLTFQMLLYFFSEEIKKHCCKISTIEQRLTWDWRTNIPLFSSQSKYFFPWTVPLFFPLASSRTTPTHLPDYRKTQENLLSFFLHLWIYLFDRCSKKYSWPSTPDHQQLTGSGIIRYV